MKSVGLFEAKTRLSELCREVATTGGEYLITRRGQAIARIVPLALARPLGPRVPGRFKGQFGPLTDEILFESLPPEFSGLIPSPTDPIGPL